MFVGLLPLGRLLRSSEFQRSWHDLGSVSEIVNTLRDGSHEEDMGSG